MCINLLNLVEEGALKQEKKAAKKCLRNQHKCTQGLL